MLSLGDSEALLIDESYNANPASMRAALSETERRRARQQAYNEEHGITPTTIIKSIDDVLSSVYERDYSSIPAVRDDRPQFHTQAELDAHIASLDKDMRTAAANLDFERAAARALEYRAHAIILSGMLANELLGTLIDVLRRVKTNQPPPSTVEGYLANLKRTAPQSPFWQAQGRPPEQYAPGRYYDPEVIY